MTLRLATKEWNAAVDAHLDKGVKSGKLIVAGENYVSLELWIKERFKFATRVIFLLNIIECSSLENVDLLHTNLQEIEGWGFYDCSILKSMTIPDSLQALGQELLRGCYELVPSNINTSDNDAVVARLRSQMSLNALLSEHVSVLDSEINSVLNSINTEDTDAVVTRLRSQMSLEALLDEHISVVDYLHALTPQSTPRPTPSST